MWTSNHRFSGRMFAAACALLLVASCASTASAPTASSEGPTSGTPSANSPATTDTSSVRGRFPLPDDYEIVSSLLIRDSGYRPEMDIDYLPKTDGMPTGVVILNDNNRNKNQEVCEALFGKYSTVPTENEAEAENPARDFLVTYWLSVAPVPEGASCKRYLDEYDYARADNIRETYGIGNLRGPVFLAVDRSGESLFLDLSDASRAEVFTATSNWMELALTAAGSSPNPARRNAPRGIAESLNRLFVKLASGYASLVDSPVETLTPFVDPVTRQTKTFKVYLADSGYRIGSTFEL